jgi:hypothetical protein
VTLFIHRVAHLAAASLETILNIPMSWRPENADA